MPNICTVYTTVDSLDVAKLIAKNAVGEALVACVNIFPAVSSIYRWKNTVETATEVPILFKLPADKLQSFRKWLNDAHPYETPAIIIYNADTTPEYFTYMQECTSN